MKLKEMFENHSIVTIQADDNLDLALQIMLWGGVRHLPVMEGERLIGILSQRDIVAFQTKVGSRIAARSLVKEIMSVPPITAGPEDNDTHAVELMVSHRVGCIPVLDRGRLLGIVTRSDFLAAQARTPREQDDEKGPRVTSIMKADVATVAGDDYLLDAIARMESRGVRHLPVVDGDRRVIGMLSDRDVRTAFGNALRPLGRGDAHVRLQSTRVQDVMSTHPSTVSHDTTVEQVTQRFIDQRIGAVPVVDDDSRLMGMVSYIDVLSSIAPELRQSAPG